MAELLVYTRNNSHGGISAQWQPGMVVDVQPDGYTWGKRESKSAWVASGNIAASWSEPFVVIKIPGVPVNLLNRLTVQQTVDDNGDAIEESTPCRRRELKLDLPELVRLHPQDIVNTGEITISLTELRQYITRIRDNTRVNI